MITLSRELSPGDSAGDSNTLVGSQSVRPFDEEPPARFLLNTQSQPPLCSNLMKRTITGQDPATPWLSPSAWPQVAVGGDRETILEKHETVRDKSALTVLAQWTIIDSKRKDTSFLD
jgi:hypothetical protein